MSDADDLGSLAAQMRAIAWKRTAHPDAVAEYDRRWLREYRKTERGRQNTNASARKYRKSNPDRVSKYWERYIAKDGNREKNRIRSREYGRRKRAAEKKAREESKP